MNQRCLPLLTTALLIVSCSVYDPSSVGPASDSDQEPTGGTGGGDSRPGTTDGASSNGSAGAGGSETQSVTTGHGGSGSENGTVGNETSSSGGMQSCSWDVPGDVYGVLFPLPGGDMGISELTSKRAVDGRRECRSDRVRRGDRRHDRRCPLGEELGLRRSSRVRCSRCRGSGLNGVAEHTNNRRHSSR